MAGPSADPPQTIEPGRPRSGEQDRGPKPPLVEEEPVARSEGGLHATDEYGAAEATVVAKKKWVKRAIVVTWTCIIVTVVYGVVTLAVAIADKSSSLLAYALESLLDAISSFFVVWRFWGAWGKDILGSVNRREDQASVGISVFFVILAGIIIGAASDELATHTPPERAVRIIVLSVVGLVASVVMGLAKWKVAHETHSAVLQKDAWASFAGALLSLGSLFAGLVYGADPSYWWVDALVALIVGCGLLVYGAWALVVYRWWTRDFWRRQAAAPVSSAPSSSSSSLT